jgi:hypothetical protein
MGLFSNIMSKIFGSPAAVAQTPPARSPASSQPAASSPGPAAAPAASVPVAAAAPAAAPPSAVDVASVLDGLAKQNPEKLDWRRSIVDLMKLVGIDSSLSARKELARELNYQGDTSDSAKMNIWLHKEVIKKLAANGGKVPAALLD